MFSELRWFRWSLLILLVPWALGSFGLSPSSVVSFGSISSTGKIGSCFYLNSVASVASLDSTAVGCVSVELSEQTAGSRKQRPASVCSHEAGGVWADLVGQPFK